MLSQRLKDLRTEQKMTQRVLAQKLNVTLGAVAMWETDKRIPDTGTLVKIADLFDVSLDYLLERNNQKNKNEGIAPPIKMESIARGGEMWTTEISQENYMKFVMKNKDCAVTLIKNGVIVETIRLPDDKVNIIQTIALSLRDEK